jgi:hypothetical protein
MREGVSGGGVSGGVGDRGLAPWRATERGLSAMHELSALLQSGVEAVNGSMMCSQGILGSPGAMRAIEPLASPSSCRSAGFMPEPKSQMRSKDAEWSLRFHSFDAYRNRKLAANQEVASQNITASATK